MKKFCMYLSFVLMSMGLVGCSKNSPSNFMTGLQNFAKKQEEEDQKRQIQYDEKQARLERQMAGRLY